MRIAKYFKFTICGENLPLEEIKQDIDLPCRIFKKDEIEFATSLKLPIKQKNDRWVYSSEDLGDKSLSKFLTDNLLLLNKKIDVLKKYINKYKSFIEINIYADDKTDICLSKNHLKLLNNIGVKFYVSFC